MAAGSDILTRQGEFTGNLMFSKIVFTQDP